MKKYIRLESDDLSISDQKQERLLSRIKNAIFVTYFQILETKTLSENMGIMMIVIFFVQMIAMSFNQHNSDLMNSYVSSLLSLSDYVLLYPAVLNESSPLFNILFISLALIVLTWLFLSIFYLSNKTNHDDPFIKSYKSVWGVMSELTDKIFVVPVIGLTVGNISCGFQKDQMTCLGPLQIVLIVVCIICVSLLAILQLLYVYLFFNFTFKIKDSFSRNPSGMQLLFLVCRIIITIFQASFDQSSRSNYITTVIMHLIFGLILFYDALTSFPYHNKNVSKAHGLFASAYLWINTTFLVLLIAQVDMMHENILIIVGLGLVFFVKLFLNIRNYYVKLLMNNELDEIQSDVLVDIKLRTYNTLAKTLDIKKSELLLASLLKIHYDKCQNKDDCPCRRRNQLLDPKGNDLGDNKIQFHKDQVFVKHFIARMAKDGLNKFKDSKLLYLDLIFYRFEALRIYASIYFEIMKFEEKFHNDMSLAIEFCLYRLCCRLQKYLNDRNKNHQISGTLVTENVRKFDEGIIRLKENIITVNRNFNDLWESLQDLVPDLAKILDIGNKAINNIQITNQLYEDLIALNNQSQDLKNIMDIYTTNLIFDDLLAFKVNKDIFMPNMMEVDNSLQLDIEQILKNYNIFDENSCVMTISPRVENQGQILWVSRNVSSIFGFEESDLLNMNVNQLMPEPISMAHNKILKYYYDNGRERFSKNVSHIWALDQDKYCFSANIFVKILPTIKSYDIMGFIHKLNSEDYIVTDVDGMVYGSGRRICQLIELKPKTICETRFNIQLLAPKLMVIYKQFFVDFDDIQLPTDNKDAKLMQPPDDSKIEELKFFIFIPNNVEEKLRSFVEARFATFKKFNVDLITKERFVRENLFANDKNNQQINTLKQLIKSALDFKSAYAELLHRINKKISTKNLRKIIRVKAQIKNFSFWNGTKYQTLKIIKINQYDVKKAEYLKKNQEKVKSQEKFVMVFINQLKKEHQDFKSKKMKMRAEVEEEHADDLDLQALGVRKSDGDTSGPPVPNQIKGIMGLFKKQAKPAPPKNSVFQKMNKFGNIMKQGTFQGQDQGEQNVNKLKGAILMTLFKAGPKQQQQRTSNRKGTQRLSKTNVKYQKKESTNSGQLDLERNGFKQKSNIDGAERQYGGRQSLDEFHAELHERKKIEITPEHLERIHKCAAIPKIVACLQKQQLIGVSEFSIFYDREAAKSRKRMIMRGMAKLRHICESVRFKEYVEKQRQIRLQNKINDKHDSDTSEGEDDHNSRQGARSDFSKGAEDEDRNLLRILERKEVKEEERAVQQSIGSSTSSLQTHNALRMLRESLKQMKAPKILITANYLILLLCIMIVCLTIVQYVYIQNDFKGIKQLLEMYQRVNHYSEAITEIYDGYQTLTMINEKTLGSDIYTPQWQSDYRKQLQVTLRELVAFFLDDFQQSGQSSFSGYDLRAYLFQIFNASTLMNIQNHDIEVNFQTFVRLFTNQVNQTISLPLYDFSDNPRDNLDYFYFINTNFEAFIQASQNNYDLVGNLVDKTLTSLKSAFILFWVFGFVIILTCYLVIYPIILRTKITIHETLRIFTKISMRDVDHYSEHYKKIFMLLKTIQDSGELIQKVDDEILLLKQQYIKQKAHDSRALSRSRNYKGIKINKVVFFIVMTFWLAIFASFILAKDIFLINYISDSSQLNLYHKNLFELKYTYESNFVLFKKAFNKNILNRTLDEASLEKLLNSIDSSQTDSITVNNLKTFSQYSSSYNYFVENLLTNNSCELIFAYPVNYTITKEDCNRLGNKIFQKGILNFYLLVHQDMLNGIELLMQSSQSSDKSVLLKEIREQKYQDYVKGFLLAKLFGKQWLNVQQQAYFAGMDAVFKYFYDQQLLYNQYFVISLSIITSIFFVVVWLREYQDLKQSSKWVNGFILLIPINILKENQYIRTFLKKKLNVQSLMYL